jgi:hypothetical protein
VEIIMVWSSGSRWRWRWLKKFWMDVDLIGFCGIKILAFVFAIWKGVSMMKRKRFMK